MKKFEINININASSERVIQAFTDPAMLRGWWGVERSLIDLQAGGVYTLAWNISEKGFGYVSTGIVRNFQRNSLLEVERLVYLNPAHPILGPMTLMVKVKEKNGNTELYLCQDGYQTGDEWDWYYTAVKTAWPIALKALKEYLETKKV